MHGGVLGEDAREADALATLAGVIVARGVGWRCRGVRPREARAREGVRLERERAQLLETQTALVLDALAVANEELAVYRGIDVYDKTVRSELASVRAQLERAQAQNRDLEAMMRRQAANTEKLQGLVEASTPGPS